MQGAPVFFAYTASWGEDGPSVWESSTSLARVSQTEQNLVLLFLGSPGFVHRFCCSELAASEQLWLQRDVQLQCHGVGVSIMLNKDILPKIGEAKDLGYQK